jgi:hypothetical protein
MCYARDNVRACKALRRSTIGHHRRPWACPSNRHPGINWTQLNWTLFHWSLSRISTTSWLQCYRTLSITTVCYGALWCRALLVIAIHRYRDERMQTIQLDTTNLPSQTTDSAW